MRILKSAKSKFLLYKSFYKRISSFLRAVIAFWQIRLNVKHVYGPKQINLGESDVIVLCLVRNGETYIEEFIKHHSSLGAGHIVFLDNDSTDQTIEIAKQYPNITILRTTLSFKILRHSAKVYLIRHYAKNRWSLCVDIDEFFDYPYSDKISFTELIGYLNLHQYTAVTCQMLDMVPGKWIRGNKISFHRKDCLYYELDNIYQKKRLTDDSIVSNEKIRHHSGGIRKTIFGLDTINLTKYSLIFYGNGTSRSNLSNHKIRNARIADFSAVLFHYKFTGNFFECVKEAIRTENYHNNSFEYKAYYEHIKDKTILDFSNAQLQHLGDTNKLIAKQFLVVSKEYESFSKRDKL